MKQNCNNCVHAFYRLNLFINIDRKKKLKLLNNLLKKNVNCNEGPCPEIYKEKVFKKLKINTSQKLFNTIQIGKQSFVYHINPFIKSSKLKNDIKILKKILAKYI